MVGLGTLANTFAVIVGGLIGMGLKKGISEQVQNSLMKACGVATIFIGISGTLSKMLIIENNQISTQGTMLLIFSLVIGTTLGEYMHLEDKMEIIGEKIKRKIKRDNDNGFVEGFVNVSLIICVGAMAIVGSIQDGVSGDYSMLVAKAVLDGIIVMVFAASYGIGSIFSAIPILIYQGSITIIASVAGAFLSDTLINNLTFIGSALIFCVGINIAFDKKFKVGNMLPAILIPIVANIIGK